MTEKMVKVPKGKVLVSYSGDWFTYENFATGHDEGSEVSEESFKSGKILSDGESLEVTEKLRNDAPGEKRDYTITRSRITNNKGRAETVELDRRISP